MKRKQNSAADLAALKRANFEELEDPEDDFFEAEGVDEVDVNNDGDDGTDKDEGQAVDESVTDLIRVEVSKVMNVSW